MMRNTATASRSLSRGWATRWLLIWLLATAAARIGAEETVNPFAGDAEAAKEGQELFLKAGCHPCHGLEARGATGPDLTDDQWRYKPTDDMLFRTITKGRKSTPMPAFEGKLAPAEVWKIVEFLRAKNRARHAAETPAEN